VSDSTLTATSSRPARRVDLSTPNLVIAAVLLGMLPLIVRRVGDPDYWWHIRTAQWIVDNHALPSHDLYTYTVMDHVWTDHEYLSQLLLYALQSVGGRAAVSIGFGAIIWAGFWLILRRISLRPVPFIVTAAALALGALAGEGIWLPRPQAITFTLVCLELYWIETFLAGRSRALYFLPPLIVLWANLHGGFVIALVLLFAAFLVEGGRWLFARDPATGDRVRALALIGVASGIAGLINPHFVSLYVYTWQTETSGVQQSFIREWHSPDFHSLDTRGLEAMIVLLLIGVAARRLRAWDIAISIVGLVLALQSLRHIAIFVAAATPVLAWAWGPIVRDAIDHNLPASLRTFRLRKGDDIIAARLLVVGALLVGAGATGVALSNQNASTNANYPVAAANWLAANPQTGTRMFSDYGWGGYMAYRFYPDPNRRVFVFGEADLMGDTIMTQYADVVTLNGDWRSILDSYRVDYVVFEPDTPLTSALATLPNWHLAYSDDVADIYVRSST
jgi:hypothetical protein